MGYRTMDRAIGMDLPVAYRLSPTDAFPVAGGWLNRKWKIQTARGPFLVKQFSRTRFRPEQLVKIEAALERQIRVGKAGVPCPEILLSGGRPLRYLDDGTVYMVMTFCEGRAETPETVTAEQMRSLGEVCGRLQKAFSSLPASETAGEPADGTRLLAKLTENADDAAQTSVPTSHNPRYSAAVAARKPILDTLSPAFFLHLPTGIAHEDFTPDNMLFDGNRVSAILDFDRNGRSFLWHDVGRAILSLALQNGTLDLQKVQAFVSGYAAHEPFGMENVADALRITWCIETPWWIRPEFFGKGSPKVARFREEILWLTENWFRLDQLTLPRLALEHCAHTVFAADRLVHKI